MKLDFNQLAIISQAISRRNNAIEVAFAEYRREKEVADTRLRELFDNRPELYDYLHSNFDMNEILPNFDYTPF